MGNVFGANSLSKKFKKHLAVDGVTMNINRGDIYGFVGENGSGKTTVIRLLSGLIHPDSGSFSLFGVSNTDPLIGQARKRMGAIVESPSIYLNLSARENLKMQSMLLNINDEGKERSALERVGLGALYEDKKHAGDFSLGMRQRLGIAMALLGDPEFLILDEPMNGLDPAGIVEIRELILRLNQEQAITFLISSHILSELSLVATKYGIISKGRLIKEITAEQLHRECTKITAISAEDPAALCATLREKFPQYRIEAFENGARIYGAIEMNEILAVLLSAQIRILSVNCYETSFEDYYLSVIGGASHA